MQGHGQKTFAPKKPLSCVMCFEARCRLFSFSVDKHAIVPRVCRHDCSHSIRSDRSESYSILNLVTCVTDNDKDDGVNVATFNI